MLKNVIISLASIILLFSTAQAESGLPESGTTKISVDWDRIEQGINTGDFSCKGSCLEVSIDWKKTWKTLSGQDYMSKRKSNISYCISNYQAVASGIERIKTNLADGKITQKQSELLIDIKANYIESTDLVCSHYLGEEKAQNLKNSIL